MQNQINLNQLSITELNAMAYDQIVQQENIVRNLELIYSILNKKVSEANTNNVNNTEQSSKPQFMPCPKNGTVACAASPIKATLPLVHGKQRIIANDDSGWSSQFSATEGINS